MPEIETRLGRQGKRQIIVIVGQLSTFNFELILILILEMEMEGLIQM